MKLKMVFVAELFYSYGFTIGNVYEVEEGNTNLYIMGGKNFGDNDRYVPMQYFLTIEEYRQTQIDKLL